MMETTQEMRQEDVPVQTYNIIGNAQKISRWVYFFLEQWNLSIGCVTRVGQQSILELFLVVQWKM
jgi:hypothetical protein